MNTPSINLRVSPKIQSFLDCLPKSDRNHSNLINFLRNREDKTIISYKLLISLHDYTKENNLINEVVPIWRLLSSTEVIYPKEEVVRNPEVEKRVKALKLKFEEQAYRKMTSNLVPLRTDSQSARSLQYSIFGNDIKCMNRQMIMVLNFILIVGGSFVFGYYAASVFGAGDVKTSTRLITGFGFALVVFFADLYFLLKNVQETENII